VSDSFDPYREWLGLDRCPSKPNFYQLLDLPIGEPDLDRIRLTADRSLAMVRRCRPGSHSAQWADLLDQLTAARECLTNESAKRNYDATLPATSAASTDKQISPSVDLAKPGSDNPLYPPGHGANEDVPAAVETAAVETAPVVAEINRPDINRPVTNTETREASAPLSAESLDEPLPDPMESLQEADDPMSPLDDMAALFELPHPSALSTQQPIAEPAENVIPERAIVDTTESETNEFDFLSAAPSSPQSSLAPRVAVRRRATKRSPLKRYSPLLLGTLAFGCVLATAVFFILPKNDDRGSVTPPQVAVNDADEPKPLEQKPADLLDQGEELPPAEDDPLEQIEPITSTLLVDDPRREKPAVAPSIDNNNGLPDPEQLEKLSSTLSSIRQNLTLRDFAKVDSQLVPLRLLAQSKEHRQMAARLESLASLVEDFWTRTGEAISQMGITAEIKVGKSYALVVDASPEKIVLRMAGVNKTFRRPFTDLPAPLAIAIVQSYAAENDFEALTELGAFTLVDSRPDQATAAIKAHDFWNKATTLGADLNSLLPILNDNYETINAPAE